LNEFGNIAGRTTNANGALRATLWTPVAGPLLTSTDENPEMEAAAAAGPQAARVAACTARHGVEWSRRGIAALKTCIARE
jgi:hypothetical protein